MCGLFGWLRSSAADASVSAKENNQSVGRTQRHVLAAVLAGETESRGRDSWGVFGLDQGVRKAGVGRITSGISTLEMSPFGALIGHTRLATNGSIASRNSHPFVWENEIVGAHNGMIYNHKEMNRKHGRNHEVDSMHIFRHLYEERDTEQLSGYGAIVYAYLDGRTTLPQVNFVRLNRGELSIMEVPGFGLVWASERDVVQRAINLAGLTGQFIQIEQNKRYMGTKGKLYSTDDEVYFDTFGGRGGSGGGYSHGGYGGHSGVYSDGHWEEGTNRRDAWSSYHPRSSDNRVPPNVLPLSDKKPGKPGYHNDWGYVDDAGKWHAWDVEERKAITAERARRARASSKANLKRKSGLPTSAKPKLLPLTKGSTVKDWHKKKDDTKRTSKRTFYILDYHGVMQLDPDSNVVYYNKDGLPVDYMLRPVYLDENKEPMDIYGGPLMWDKHDPQDVFIDEGVDINAYNWFMLAATEKAIDKLPVIDLG